MPDIVTSAEKKIKLVINRIHNLPTPPMVFSQVNKVANTNKKGKPAEKPKNNIISTGRFK